MKLTMLGTGNAMTSAVYNTCFVLEDEHGCFLVDGGGGNTLLDRLNEAQINWMDIHDIFVTHKHIDHLLGIVWMLRLYLSAMSRGRFEGEVNIYSHAEVTGILEMIARSVLGEKETAFIGDKLHFISVEDGEKRIINEHEVTFFDIHSTKARQFGFAMMYDNGKKLTCCGDEPCHESCYEYVRDSEWLLHEAFCLYADKDKFNPYKISHSTVKDGCELAEKLNVKNLVLYHTEDQTIAKRKETYTAEGKQYFSGNLFVPDDLETIVLI